MLCLHLSAFKQEVLYSKVRTKHPKQKLSHAASGSITFLFISPIQLKRKKKERKKESFLRPMKIENIIFVVSSERCYVENFIVYGTKEFLSVL